jgi:hypothetical protein
MSAAGPQAGRCTASVRTAGSCITGSLRLCESGKEGIMTARPEVVALLTDFDVQRAGARQRFVHRDGRPFTAEETELIASATDEDMRAAAGQLAAAPQRLTELIAPYIHAVAEDIGDRRPPAGAP